MSYERDKDRMTRGVGAIAALDGVMPSRQAVRQRIDQATRRRDRSMVAVTNGALGMTALGLVRDTRGPAISTIKTPLRTTTVDHRTGAPRAPSSLPPAAPPPGGGITHLPGVYGPPPPTKIAYPGMPGPVTVTPTPVMTAPAPTPTAPPPTTTSTSTTKTTTTTTSSGGGGGTSTTKAPTPIVPTVAPPAPDPDITSSGMDTSKMLIIGGLALGALLLLRRQDR